MGEACTASSVVGGWAVRYVGVFLRPVGDQLFVLFLKIPASHWWCLGVPPSSLLHSSVLYYNRTYYCTAVLLLFHYFVFLVLTYRELTLYYCTYCCTAVLPCYFFGILVLT